MRSLLLVLLVFICAAFAAAQDSPHGEISIPCETCHSTENWVVRADAAFNHNSTGFPLEGRHQAATCRSCHENLVFTGKSPDCASCHADVHQKELGPDCLRCHNNQAWTVPDMRSRHEATRLPLMGRHKLIDCDDCHTRASEHRFAGTPLACIACHKQQYEATTAPNHVAAGFGVECMSCHRPNDLSWPGGFDHDLTSFPLTGMHRTLPCADCHKDNKFDRLSVNCYDCHKTDFDGASNPSHTSGGFSHVCSDCHNTAAWRPASFDHSATDFPLTGKHARVECQECHTNGNYQLQYTDCFQCHSGDFGGVTSPNHTAGGFSHQCLTCHSTSTWSPSTFSHASTAFPLTGAHTSITCQSCHVGGNYALSYANCYQCHQSDFDGTTDPNHVAGNFSHDCLTCHSTTAWEPSTFSHATTAFPLTGAHTTITCQSCHVGGNYALTYANCYQCHKPDFDGTTNPNHVAGNFSQNCLTCHTTTAWSPASFDHATTQFALTGAHTTIQCASCHVNGNYQLAYTDCYQCHKPDFDGTTNPNHVTGNFAHDCLTCHTTAAWSPASFDHNATRFALTGAHTAIQCASCHVNNNYQLTYTDCYQCHKPDFDGTTNPNHVTLNFAHDCLTCHTTSNWSPASFDHSTTRFTLTGAHLGASCTACHVNNNYQLSYSDCFQCHSAEYNGRPDHVSQNFSHDCLTCHTTSSWDPPTFSHSATAFSLTGAHTTIQCIGCHVNGNYQLTYAECYQCHQPAFEATTSPNHVSQAIGHDCTTCHTTSVWQPTTYDHARSGLPLTGAHATIQCVSCHISGNYQLSYQSCYQCHQPDFEATTGPNHVTQGISHDCTTCHSTSVWQPSTFDHARSALPLTGAHITIQCASCHVNGNYQLTYQSCYACHTADFEATTSPNHVTQSINQNCVTCHTTTAWQPSSFSHATTAFPLTGAHTTIQCVSCHVNGNYQLTYQSCYACHTADFEATTSPDHVTQSIGQNCVTCHTTSVWQPSTFSHATTAFPLTGSHTTLQCVSCHVSGNYQLSYQSCYQCHQAEYTATTNPNHVAKAIGQNCATCHTTTDWSPAGYDHAVTTFPLTGAHTSVSCTSCHVGGNYQLTYTNCYACHQSDYTATTNPNHAAQGIGQDCVQCHTTTAWSPANFDHAATAFPLTGAHTTIVCASCHVGGNYQLSYQSCYQCHQPEYEATTLPSHTAQSFSHDCMSCHSTAVWQPSTFSHATTAFPLTGAHTSLECVSCHLGGNYQLAYTDCYACHQPTYEATTNPNHVANGIGQNCTQCHTTAAWSPASFDHATTAFPLTGAHTAVVCASCHVSGNYQLSYQSCYQCHQPDYEGTTNPNHVAQGFGTTCASCHTTTAWSPATFNHATTAFPLTGAHTTINCSSCHVNGNYQLAYTDCYACHKPDFESPTDPNHVAPNWSHNCTPCHTTTAWLPTTFPHDANYFRIWSGRHLPYWTSCYTCHTDPANYTVYTCFNCHTHDKAVTDSHHTSVSGYLYISSACYNCHRRV